MDGARPHARTRGVNSAMLADRLLVRWTVGAVSRRGFEALQLSVWGAHRVFGPRASYVICVNSVAPGDARALTGPLPPGVLWRESRREELPEFLRRHLDATLSEGTSWKFAPLRLAPDRYELALDNDCILWAAPAALRTWLDGAHPSHTVLAEDVRPCFGQFAQECGPAPRNSGIRGLPPGFDLAAALAHALDCRPTTLRSELDEQGLQTFALAGAGPVLVVAAEEVTICSPFPPHVPHLGTCGAHFVGLNAHALPWEYEGRPATALTAEHWERLRPGLEERVGLFAGHASDRC